MLVVCTTSIAFFVNLETCQLLKVYGPLIMELPLTKQVHKYKEHNH
jgi:hypothetical protein